MNWAAAGKAFACSVFVAAWAYALKALIESGQELLVLLYLIGSMSFVFGWVSGQIEKAEQEDDKRVADKVLRKGSNPPPPCRQAPSPPHNPPPRQP